MTLRHALNVESSPRCPGPAARFAKLEAFTLRGLAFGTLRPGTSARRLLGAAVLAGACGCSTTVSTIEPQRAEQQRERADITLAASKLESDKWTRAGFRDGPISLISGKSADLTAERYAETLGNGDSALAALMHDADQALKAAAQLIDAVETTFSATGLRSASPTMEDVALLEDAIQTMRFQRAVFLACVDILPADNADRQLASVSIRGRFDAASIKLADLADDIAAAALEARFSAAGVGAVNPRTASDLTLTAGARAGGGQ
ncbi:MAG: hypothetical protein GC152_09990 [Alphaproteobacteria bacterium]|nr:hypothetical protein [Alphaproteobacteria bacterium]